MVRACSACVTPPTGTYLFWELVLHAMSGHAMSGRGKGEGDDGIRCRLLGAPERVAFVVRCVRAGWRARRRDRRDPLPHSFRPTSRLADKRMATRRAR